MPAIQTLELRSGLAATWTSVNPVLNLGELGAEIDTGKFKIGDGSTAWNSLAYQTTTAGNTQSLIFESFGDGSDGNVTISSGVTTLTRDMFYNNLTINGTGSLNSGGYKIFVKNILDISAAPTGAITISGVNGGNANKYQPGIIPAAPVAGSVGAGNRGVVGVIGAISTLTNGNNATASPSVADGGSSNSAGNGGSGLAGSNGTGGTGVAPTYSFPIIRYETNLIFGTALIGAGMGGASGSSGMGDGHYQGGGSGAGGNGGGILAIFANIINKGTNTNPGVIQANGGNGGNGDLYSTTISIGGGGGGGSGGGGGWIFLVYNTLAGSTITNGLQANGGNGGNAGNGNNTAYHWVVRKSTNNGTSWVTNDDFIYTSGDSSLSNAFAKDLAGNLYAVGFGRTVANVVTWLVRKSTDNGVTWNTVDTFVYTGGANSQAQAICVDLLGNIYVAGLGDAGSSHYHWVVRQSTNNGTSWATIDDYLYTGGTDTKAFLLGVDSLGYIYAGGYGRDASSSHWVVRQSTNNGTSWATVDDFQYAGGVTNEANGFALDNLGNVYVCGFGGDATPVYRWLTRKSTNNGTSWATVDDFVYTGGIYSAAAAMTVDTLGNIYASGFGCDVSSVSYRWVTRQSTNNGTSWATVDDFVYPGNTYTISNAMVVDGAGNIFTAGLGDDSVGGQQHWLVRKSSNNGTSWATVDDFLYSSGNPNNAAGLGLDSLGDIFAVGYGVGPGSVTANGGTGGSGGNGGSIFALQATTSIALVNIANNSSTGSAGNTNTGSVGGTGGAGGVTQANI